jgi:hypothetical protein
VLGLVIGGFYSTASAEMVTVTVGFEQFADQIGPNSAWGGRTGDWNIAEFPKNFRTPTGNEHPWGYPEYQYKVDGVTFFHYGGTEYSYWTGTGISTRIDPSEMWFTNEMAAMPGSGNNGSSVYGVIYGESTVGMGWDHPMLPVMMFTPGVELVSMAITNTGYTWGSISNGDWIAEQGGVFNLLIYGVDVNGLYVGTVTQGLSGYDDDGKYFVLSDWLTVDLSSLVGATELRFEFETEGVDLTYGTWHDYPVYFAFDDIVYRYDDGTSSTPEPATLAVLGLGLAGLVVAVRRRK